MDLYIYSDESGVFDYKHENYFVFGGLICFGKAQKEAAERMYLNVEKTIRSIGCYSKDKELKASLLKNKEKAKIYRSLNGVYKFSIVIEQKKLLTEVFENTKHKQRFLDFYYKLVLKKMFCRLISKGILDADKVENINVYCDEHTTATDGIYELRENLLNEFKYGTFNFKFDCFYEPIFPKLKDVKVLYCNSSKKTLVRAADIIANHIYKICNNDSTKLDDLKNIYTLKVASYWVYGTDGLDYFTSHPIIY